MCEQSTVGNYYRLEPKRRVDAILYHYGVFPAIINDYEAELEDWIITERAAAIQRSHEALGIRIQSGRSGSSPIENEIIDRDQVELIVKTGELGYYGEGLPDAEEIQRGLWEIRLMRHEYRRTKKRIEALDEPDREFFFNYLQKGKGRLDLSESLMITEKSLLNRIYRIKKRLLGGFVSRLGSYTDDTISLLRYVKEANE